MTWRAMLLKIFNLLFLFCFLFFVFTKHGYLKLLTEAIPRNLVASALNGLANHWPTPQTRPWHKTSRTKTESPPSFCCKAIFHSVYFILNNCANSRLKVWEAVFAPVNSSFIGWRLVGNVCLKFVFCLNANRFLYIWVY